MNRGIVLSLLLLAFLVVFVSADALLISEAIGETETALSALDEAVLPAHAEVSRVLEAFEGHRFLLSVSVPMHQIEEFESALTDMASASKAQDEDGYTAARARAFLFLSQIKRSALFSKEQIF